jgi:hypothetical protein
MLRPSFRLRSDSNGVLQSLRLARKDGGQRTTRKARAAQVPSDRTAPRKRGTSSVSQPGRGGSGQKGCHSVRHSCRAQRVDQRDRQVFCGNIDTGAQGPPPLLTPAPWAPDQSPTRLYRFLPRGRLVTPPQCATAARRRCPSPSSHDRSSDCRTWRIGTSDPSAACRPGQHR